ncbi:MAG: hypothetical protein M5U28_47690 [Sandaracinaceae bacterium]|nr:hypothetical protein [Sandaracinaceae bacterium]
MVPEDPGRPYDLPFDPPSGGSGPGGYPCLGLEGAPPCPGTGGDEGGDTGGEGGDTGSEGGDTGSEGGDTGSEGGDTGSEGGDTGSEGGDTGSDGGDTGSDGGDTGSDGGDTGSDGGDTGSDGGDTGSEGGDTGSEGGDTGGEGGDTGSSGEEGGDTGGSETGGEGGSETAEHGCTYTRGYWRASASWPLESLTLGSRVYSASEAWALLALDPMGDASLILAQQLVAAVLNVANGASPIAAIADAQAWLSANGTVLPFGIATSSAAGMQAVALATTLRDYNEGHIGPGHCER